MDPNTSLRLQIIKEVSLCLSTGRRTAKFERLLLELFDERDRPHIQQALALLPAVTPQTLRMAFAAREFIATVNQFGTDQECADFMSQAQFPGLSSEQIIRAGRRKLPEVNGVLRAWGVIGATKSR